MAYMSYLLAWDTNMIPEKASAWDMNIQIFGKNYVKKWQKLLNRLICMQVVDRDMHNDD